MVALLLLFSFTCGVVVGLATAHRITTAIAEVEARLKKLSYEKRSGVVRPPLAGMPNKGDEIVNTLRKSSVVRPRPPQTADDDKKLALSSVRNRANNE